MVNTRMCLTLTPSIRGSMLPRDTSVKVTPSIRISHLISRSNASVKLFQERRQWFVPRKEESADLAKV